MSQQEIEMLARVFAFGDPREMVELAARLKQKDLPDDSILSNGWQAI